MKFLATNKHAVDIVEELYLKHTSTTRSGVVQNIPVMNVIVLPENRTAARNRRRENLNAEAVAARQRKEMEVANAKAEIVAAEESIVHDAQQVVEEFSAFLSQPIGVSTSQYPQCQNLYTRANGTQGLLCGLVELKDDALAICNILQDKMNALKKHCCGLRPSDWHFAKRILSVAAALVPVPKKRAKKSSTDHVRKSKASNRGIATFKKSAFDMVRMSNARIRERGIIQPRHFVRNSEVTRGVITQLEAQLALSTLVRYQQQRQQLQMETDPSVFDTMHVHAHVILPQAEGLQSFDLHAHADEYTHKLLTDLSHAYYDIDCRSIEADERQLQMGSPVDEGPELT